MSPETLMLVVIPTLVRQRGFFWAVLAAFLITHLPVRVFAETNPFAGLPPAKVPSLPSAQAPQELPQQQAAPAQEADRKNGASSAETMAAVGAAVAAAMCAMMMAQAQQMPPGPEKNQMMMQAMQQCAQAAANQKNAGENEKAKNAVANNNTPTGTQQTAKNPESKNPLNFGNSGEETTTPTPDTAGNFDLPEPSLSDPDSLPVPTDPASSYDFGGSFAGGSGMSTPKSIENSEVTFNENNKGDEAKINTTGSANFGGFASNGTLPTPGAQAKNEDGEGKAGKRNTGSEGHDGDDLSSGEGSGAGGKDPVAFDKMLSDIMGGKQEPIPVLGQNSGIVVLRNVGNRKMTIFELANTRYKRAGYNEGLVDVRKPGRYRAPASIPDQNLVVSK